MAADRCCGYPLQLKRLVLLLTGAIVVLGMTCGGIPGAVPGARADARIPREYRLAPLAGRGLPHGLRFRDALLFAPSLASDDLHLLAGVPGEKEPGDGGRIRISLHRAVRYYIRFYQGKGRLTFTEALQRSWFYTPKMTDIFAAYGVPRELVYVALVESRFRHQVSSHKGARGLWQFMATTARSMGLRVNYWIDERLDPVKSTRAAARYLARLHRRFGSWELALAAYNAGAGAVSKALRKSPRKDFWSLYQRRLLPRQTRRYVPKVMAAVYLVRNLEKYGFKRPRYLPIRYPARIAIRRPVTLRQIARWTGTTVKGLRRLNPSLLLDRIPPGKSFTLRLPPPAAEKFSSAYENHLNRKS